FLKMVANIGAWNASIFDRPLAPSPRQFVKSASSANTAANALASCRFHASTNRSITAAIACWSVPPIVWPRTLKGNPARGIVRPVSRSFQVRAAFLMVSSDFEYLVPDPASQAPTTLVNLLSTPITVHTTCPVPNAVQAGEPTPRPPISVKPNQSVPL